jgi:anaphase-promoting complex subunit 5
MIRYLTPSKIGLLVLIALYTDAVVPNEAIIPILSFLITKIVPQPVSKPDSSSHPADTILSISHFEDVTKEFKATMPGRTLHDVFLQKIWTINSLHALHEFFRDLGNILTKTRAQAQLSPESAVETKGKIILSRISPLGVFVRRAQLEFVRLQFDDSSKLWVAFTKFREASGPQWRKKNRSSTGTDNIDFNLAELNLSLESTLVNIVYPTLHDSSEYEPELSTEEMERLLDFQLEKLQRKLT